MAIEKVYNQLEMYSAMADEQKNIREGSNMLAISIKKIDISNCPDDFRNAFNDLTNSYDDANQLMQKIPVSTSEKLSFVFVHLLDGEAWKMENSLKAIAEQIYEKQAKMNSVATKYGVIFDKDGNVVYRKIKQE